MRLKTQKEFEQELYNINPNIQIIGKYINSTSKIHCKCKIDGYEWNPTPDSLLQRKGCPVCSNRIVINGINDLWTTAPETAKLLENPNDGHKYTKNSHICVNWICPNCGNIIKNKSIHNVYNQTLFCPNCSDGISYPEKFMYNLLQQLNINFEYQYSPKWCKYKFKGKNKTGRYDFHIPDYNLIIEMDGWFHNNDNLMSNQTAQENKQIDIIKNKLANEHNIEVIRIDCIYEQQNNLSKFEYIKCNILDKLNILSNLSNINWEILDKQTQNSLLKEICDYKKMNYKTSSTQIGKIFNLSEGTIANYLKIGNKYGWCYYNPKEEMINSSSKQVICINNKTIYNSMLIAFKQTSINNCSISNCCRHKTKSAGKLPDGTKLHWMYLDDYMKQNGYTDISQIPNVIIHNEDQLAS